MGVALVYPIKNRPEVPSLWAAFYPRSPMRWEWDEGGDARVASLWHLREELSRSGEVAYLKWFGGRATFFELETFGLLLSAFGTASQSLPLARSARNLLDLLEEQSPLSTKQLKRSADLSGRDNESAYQRATKQLWQHGHIVGWGEVDEGAFPSLAMGATSVLFEDIWRRAPATSSEIAWQRLEKKLGLTSPFLKWARRIQKQSEATGRDLRNPFG